MTAFPDSKPCGGRPCMHCCVFMVVTAVDDGGAGSHTDTELVPGINVGQNRGW
jgi:hypothetical protein